MQQQEEIKQEQQVVKIRELPKRPQRSNQIKNHSQPIELVSNHFKVNFINAKEKIVVYTLLIEPEIARDARQLKDQIMFAAQKNIEQAGLKTYQVRGMNIWSTIKIDQPIIVEAILNSNGADLNYSVKIVYVKEYSYENFSGDLTEFKSRNPLIQATNIGIKDTLKKMGLIEIGRTSKYYDKSKINSNRMEHIGLKVWRGFKTGLHIFNQQPYLLIDFSSRVLREETALDFLDNSFAKYKNRRDVQDEMTGLSVIANYGNYRIYRIDGINFDLSPYDKFQLADGKEITYKEYYKKQYNIQIKVDDQPLIVYRDKRNPDRITYLIPELLNMTGLTDKQRANGKIMREVAQFTKLTPDERNNEIMYLQNKLADGLQSKNINLSSDQRVNGYQLYPPVINLGKKSLQNDVGFFILKDAVLNPGHIKDWFLIYPSKGKQDDQDADFLVSELQNSASRLGMKLESPYYIATKDCHPGTWLNTLDEEIRKGGRPQMIVSFVPERDKDRVYGPLKDFCLNKIGIQHQNVLFKFINNKNTASVASKIVQQMNVKLGMPLWSIPRPKSVSDRTMLIGIDIYHKLVAGNQSCMGVVASLDSEFTTYFSRVIIMKKGQEMSIEIAGVIEQAIKAYFNYNGKKFLPDTIIVYRDGVGEGQVNALIEIELTQIRNIFSNIGKTKDDYIPEFAFIMVNKKINDRFFALGGGDQGGNRSFRGAKGGPRSKLSNPPTGTIVADKYFDFFLCAQYVTEGTCTPTHYTVLCNQTSWSEETFWLITYYQCFNYLNWSGAVRVPACVQYAHKLSFLVGDTFQKQLHPDMERFLCYL